MAGHGFCNIVFAATLMASVAAASLATARGRRRAPPTNLQAITLHELEYNCAVQGWTECYSMVTDLLNTSHGVNVFIANCLHNNDPYEQPPTPEPATSTSSVTPVPASSAAPTESGSGGDELIITGEEPDETTPTKGARPPVNGSSGGARAFEEEELKCTVNVAEKNIIRSRVYCQQLFDLDAKLWVIVPYLSLLRDHNCIAAFSDPGYLTPSQIVETIRIWHEDMIDTHKKCCEVAEEGEEAPSRIFSRNLDELYGRRTDFIIGQLGCLLFFNSEGVWDHGLSIVGVMVHMLELMQGLGRRRTCLRGCVNEGQVLCTNLLPYLFPSE